MMQMLISHHSDWLESVSPTDQHRLNALEFCNLSGCDQLVHGPTHIAGNKLDLVMTDAPGIVDVFIGTPLRTSEQSFVSCVLWVEQSECNLYQSTMSEVLSS